MTTADGPLTLDALTLDPDVALAEIGDQLSEIVFRRLRKRGVIVAVSGGIDSSVAAALCVRALGADRVLALLLPESESSGDTLDLSTVLVEHLGVESVVEDITPMLDAFGCYRRRDDAIRQVVPEYGDGWRAKLVLPSVLASERLPIFSVVVESPAGERTQARLTSDAYRAVVAATSFKQRTRKMLEYYHADRLDRAVVGTPNRLEYDQGFFVKGGDGAADVKPIAHLYKTQVYQLAEHLGIPEEIRTRPPTTDTYSLPQSQEEFYFSVPYQVLDLCLYALNNGVPAASVAAPPAYETKTWTASSATSSRSAARRRISTSTRSSSDPSPRSGTGDGPLSERGGLWRRTPDGHQALRQSEQCAPGGSRRRGTDAGAHPRSASRTGSQRPFSLNPNEKRWFSALMTRSGRNCTSGKLVVRLDREPLVRGLHVVAVGDATNLRRECALAGPPAHARSPSSRTPPETRDRRTADPFRLPAPTSTFAWPSQPSAHRRERGRPRQSGSSR